MWDLFDLFDVIDIPDGRDAIESDEQWNGEPNQSPDPDEVVVGGAREDLERDLRDAYDDLEWAEKELERLLHEKEMGMIGIDPAIGWKEARIDDAEGRIKDIEWKLDHLEEE